MKQYKPGDTFQRGRERITLGVLNSNTIIGNHFDALYSRRPWWSSRFPPFAEYRGDRVFADVIPLMLMDGWRHIAGPTFSESTSVTYTTVLHNPEGT